MKVIFQCPKCKKISPKVNSFDAGFHFGDECGEIVGKTWYGRKKKCGFIFSMDEDDYMEDAIKLDPIFKEPIKHENHKVLW